ncbi:RHS repeat-associated core domain protein [Prevotella sp. DNF00663]|uniref:RHS repeat domain-containing protein n=1 Tax=unclassified Prevotella TaxID=2638335 RepID=UPI000795329F|nr:MULTISPECIES: RHS repeat-associated core domain-containing protein [unclassified Prevotella]KXB83092.1 RHS repeat-associated core domain protein [Prevotella sp. DNF00663]
MFTISPNYFRDRLPHPGTVDTVLLYYQYHIAVVTVPYLGTHNDSIDRLVKVTDIASNMLGVKNNAPLPQSGKAGGQMSYSYTYDPLYRLASATGTYKGTDNKAASYTLSMGYDNMHRITSKKQHLSQTGVQFEGTLNAGYDLTYIYGSSEGKKFQLDNVRDLNYRTEATPTDSTTINNGHKYEYDANGNLVYINTSRVKKDGKEDEKASEQKYRWDEENRLLATDENGFVANYWYDADGERTVKSSGENEEIYVNSDFSGGRTNTAKFSLYVSPYLVAGQGGKYTKHIYIGSQRVVSKIGDFDSYGSDPRRILYAGSETDGLSVDYKVKYTQQLQVIKDNYATFAVPYNGEDNNDYVDGKGFCCNDGSLEAAQARVMARAAKNNFQEGDAYEKMQFYYHPDHLGSSSYITNLDGEVVQHIEYVPFGEVFIEERNSVWNTPYLFNAKEFDEETGLYYYGARYYDPRLSLWMSTDPMELIYSWISSYCYTTNNPIRYSDPNGKEYDEVVDDNSITLRAVIFATKDSYKEAQVSAGILNNQSGKWTYDFTVKNGSVKEEHSLDIKFDVTVELVEPQEGYPAKAALQSALTSSDRTCLNAFQVVSDDKLKELVNGSTMGGNYIEVKESRQGTETGAHEIGHAMGLKHSSKGLMTAESSNPSRSRNLDRGSVKDMISYPLKGKVNSEYDPHKGADIPTGKGTLINNSKFTVQQLKKGKVNEKK